MFFLDFEKKRKTYKNLRIVSQAT